MSDDIPGLKRLLFSLQAESGAFASAVHRGDISLPDYNGTVTALVLREMERFVDAECEEPVRRALNFLERCQCPDSAMCTFWPADQCPSWAPYNPEDCDSTAVIAAELFHFGRMTPEKARFLSQESMPRFQTGAGDFLAWRSQGIVPNPPDLVVNVNVVAFLAQIGSRGSEPYRQACAAILHSSAEPSVLDHCAPYYPETAEILRAFDNALGRGAGELLPALEILRHVAATGCEPAGILFANQGRRTVWSSEAVRVARRIAESAAIAGHKVLPKPAAYT